MASYNNYIKTLFEQGNLTPIRVKPTFKTIHKLRNEIKANVKSVYSNIGGGSHSNLDLVLTDAQYELISPTPFVYPIHPGTLIISDGTTAHTNSNTRITRTEKVRLFL